MGGGVGKMRLFLELLEENHTSLKVHSFQESNKNHIGAFHSYANNLQGDRHPRPVNFLSL